LRRLVAPACNYGYDVVVYVGRALFLDAQPVRQIIAQLDRQHVHLSASTVTELGRRFIALLALAHRQSAPRLKEAMAFQGGYILHLDATYEDKSPLLMTGIDAVMEIVLGNIKLPSEKADGIIPFLRQRLQSHGTVGQLRARLRTWQKQIDADPQLQQALHQLPTEGLPTQSLAHAPLLAAYLLAHWVLAGLQQGQGSASPLIGLCWHWPAAPRKFTRTWGPSKPCRPASPGGRICPFITWTWISTTWSRIAPWETPWTEWKPRSNPSSNCAKSCASPQPMRLKDSIMRAKPLT
jgi:hypothetical protein